MNVKAFYKDELALKLLSLSPSEISELLTFLFRKMHYRVAETTFRDGLLYLHLVQNKGQESAHYLATWTGGKKSLDLPFLQQFLQSSPLTAQEGIPFQQGILISPYEFSPEFEATAKQHNILPISGQTLSQLLLENELTYYFPTLLEALGKHLWKKLPYVVAPLFLLYALFMYETMKPHSNTAPPHADSPTTTTETGNGSNEVSLLSPAFSVPVDAQNEAYKRISTESVPAVESKKPKPIEARKSSNKLNAKPSEKPQPAHVAHKQEKHPKPSSKKGTPSAGRIIHHYTNVVDLEEKYYLMAKDLEKYHHKAKAKAYYQRYLRISPNGAHAAEAKQSLTRL